MSEKFALDWLTLRAGRVAKAERWSAFYAVTFADGAEVALPVEGLDLQEQVPAGFTVVEGSPF